MQPFSHDSATVQATLRQAIDFHTAGELDRAAFLYRSVLEENASQPVALHYLGIYLHQQGQHEEAIAHIRQSCKLQPDNVDWHNDLGNVLFALHQFDAAAIAYQDALAGAPGNHEIWNNLGASRLQGSDTEGAIAAFKKAVDLAPNFGPALIHLGQIYEAAGDKMTSAHYQCRAYILPPFEGKSKEMLGIAFYFLGRKQEAAEAYRAWLAEEPDNPIAAHMYAACAQMDVPHRASDQYIETHFDRYADTFNANLVDRLAYRVPALLGQALAEIATPDKQHAVLDIGCGTGLCAHIAAPYAQSLTGVDLSAKMLEQAQIRGGYDHLIKQEITAYMTEHPDQFDIVLAADTLIYFGDLRDVCRAAAATLRKEGYFLFTVESISDEAAASGSYLLHASGRYRHGQAYVAQALEKAGLVTVRITHDTLREEIKQPVTGMLVIARRRE